MARRRDTEDLLNAAIGATDLGAPADAALNARQKKLIDQLFAETDEVSRLRIWLACHEAKCAPPASDCFRDLLIRARAEGIEAVARHIRSSV